MFGREETTKLITKREKYILRSFPLVAYFENLESVHLREPPFPIYFQLHTTSLTEWWGYGSACGSDAVSLQGK